MKNKFYYLKDKDNNIKISPVTKEYPMFWNTKGRAENYAKKHAKDYTVFEIQL